MGLTSAKTCIVSIFDHLETQQMLLLLILDLYGCAVGLVETVACRVDGSAELFTFYTEVNR